MKLRAEMVLVEQPLLTLDKVPAWVFATVVRRCSPGPCSKKLYCHDGYGTVYILIDKVPVPQKAIVSDDYLVIPGSKQWQLRITVPEGEEFDDETE